MGININIQEEQSTKIKEQLRKFLRMFKKVREKTDDERYHEVSIEATKEHLIALKRMRQFEKEQKEN